MRVSKAHRSSQSVHDNMLANICTVCELVLFRGYMQKLNRAASKQKIKHGSVTGNFQ